MLLAAKRSKLKREVEFQYGGRLFLETEVVISRPWIEIVWSKFGMPIVLAFPKGQWAGLAIVALVSVLWLWFWSCDSGCCLVVVLLDLWLW